MQQALYRLTMLIAGMAVIATLFETLIPRGKLRNTVLLALGIVFLLAVAEPLVSLLRGASFDLPVSAQPGIAATQAPTHEDLLRGYYEQAEKNG